jgi:hypothetical protein
MNPIVKKASEAGEEIPTSGASPLGPSAVEYIAEFLARNGIVRRETACYTRRITG